MPQRRLEETLIQLEQRAITALRLGHTKEAQSLWHEITKLAPNHAAAQTQLGQIAFRDGQFDAARECFQKAAAAEPENPRSWINLALAYQQLKDVSAEESAIFKALSADPYDLLALLMKGNLAERQGHMGVAAQAFGAASAVAPADGALHPELRGAVAHARSFAAEHQQRMAQFLDNYLSPYMSELGSHEIDRFKLSMDILLGRKRRFDPQPMRYFFPHLPTEEFYDRSHFPWLDDVEAATDDIREEFLKVLGQGNGPFEPYIQYTPDQPVAQWSQLNNSQQWSVFHLVKDGVPVQENALRCPRTMKVWEATPRPEQAAKTPVAFFSLLKPKTRIPPHVGASNARLIVHLPLIVPERCTYRVGNSVRPWETGKAWVFDDSVEHEAINDSDHLRVLLIFDTWNPYLNEAERQMISHMYRGLAEFSTDQALGYDS